MRFGNVAYSPDLNAIPDESLRFLEDLDLWIVDAALHAAPLSFFLAGNPRLDRRLRPKQAIITNIHSDLDFARLKSELPANVEPAFDGMRICA